MYIGDYNTGVRIRIDRKTFIIFGVFALFFGYLLFMGEPIYVDDTLQYENQMVMREPGYALLIQLLRFISPQNHYELIIIFQNLLAIVTNTMVISYMRKKFGLNMPQSMLFVLIMLVPHIMIPVFSNTHLILTNSLMTEGVLFSLYPLAIIGIIDTICEKKPLGRKSITTILLILLFSLIRGQMMVLFIAWLIVTVVMVIVNNNQSFSQILKQGIVLLIICAVAFLSRTYIVRCYNYLENGLFVDTASGSAMSFANVLYVTDREDGEAIGDEGLRELFYEIYDAADTDMMNYKYAPSGLLGRALYHEKCHDELNFTYFAEPAKRYVGETLGIYVDRYQELMIAVDDVADEMSGYLMPRVIGKYIKNYFAIIALGFVRTVAYEKSVFAWYSALMYIISIVVTVILWKKNHGSIAVDFMALMLLTIVGNVCATALMIQCISRYMIYNMPLFYMALLLEIKELLSIKEKYNGI
jgi:hypothetical protein